MRIIDTKINAVKERPQLKIIDKLYEVNNGKKTYDKIMKVQSDEGITPQEKEEKIFELAFGKKACKEIMSLDLTVEEYTYLTFCIMGAITGEDVDKLKERAEQGKN